MEQKQLIRDIVVRATLQGLTIKVLCEQAGIHPKSFSRWKAGKGASIKSLEPIIRVLTETEKANRRARGIV